MWYEATWRLWKLGKRDSLKTEFYPRRAMTLKQLAMSNKTPTSDGGNNQETRALPSLILLVFLFRKSGSILR